MFHNDSPLVGAYRVACNAALAAGKIIRSLWGARSELNIASKSNWRDLVTVADKRAEEEILKILRAEFPDYKIISEEGGGSDSTKNVDSEYIWAVDPLDGTTNFAHSYPFFCTSIGLIHRDEAVLGVVYDPIHDELFSGGGSLGAYLNGRPIQVSQTAHIRDALLVTGFAYSKSPRTPSYLDMFRYFNTESHGVRRDGAAALDMCYVACGRVDAFWELGLKVWDVSAGAAILKAAGGESLDIEAPTAETYNPFCERVLATNSKLSAEMLDIISKMPLEHVLSS